MQRIFIVSLLLLLAVGIQRLGFTAEEKIGWSIEKPVETIPAQDIHGTVFGYDISKCEVSFNTHAIEIKTKNKTGHFANAQLIIFVNEEDYGKEIVVTQKTTESVPHIHMNVMIEGRDQPGTLMYTQFYSMRLKVNQAAEDKLECAIHLSLPDYKKSYLAGTFTATR